MAGKKDFTNCVDKTKIRVDSIGKSWRVYLWKTHEDMEKQSVDDTSGAGAYHRSITYTIALDRNGELLKSNTAPVMGELHFVSNSWNVEVVSHECCHAMFLYLASHGKYDFHTSMEEEEKYCYLLGDLTLQVYRWLYDKDIYYK